MPKRPSNFLPDDLPPDDLPSGNNFGSGRSPSKLFEGFKGHVSTASQDYLRPAASSAARAGVRFAAENPDKIEKFGEVAGQVAAASLGGGFVGRKAGKKMGGKLGGFLSNKAKEASSYETPTNFGDLDDLP